MTTPTLSATHQLFLTETLSFAPDQPYPPYLYQTTMIPANASRVGALVTFYKTERRTQIFASLFAPDGFRGCRMAPGQMEGVVLELWSSPAAASEGAMPGPLPAGDWRVQLDIHAIAEPLDVQVVIYAEFDEIPNAVSLTFPDDHVVKPEVGWYKGELHAHSTESDGKQPVDTVIRAALDAGLDYFSLTDHFTVSQWRKLIPHMEQPMALIRSCEVTSHHGHANLHGMKAWVNVFVDEPGWTMNDAADAIHAQGGLFCVNHAFSGVLGWRTFDFDWSKADLYEIYHNLEGSNNVLQVPLWDRQLSHGHRIVGVGAIDSHDPFDGLHRLGQVVTWVYADELSERGILAGLRRGRVYVSKGPELRFVVRNSDGAVAEMWETLPAAGGVTLEVQVKSALPLRLFAIRDGYYLEMKQTTGAPDWQSYTITDLPTRNTYYRIELHAAPADDHYSAILRRDHETVLALSNPVWVAV
jgi:hypothetical protein